MGFLKNIFKKSDSGTIQTKQYPDYDSMSDVSQIESIFLLVFKPNSERSIECAETVHRILNSIDSFRANNLYSALCYIKIEKGDLSLLGNYETEVQNSLYCVASMNHNGYVREAALLQLIKAPTLNTFPYILVRLADWVPSIRKTAERGVKNLISENHQIDLIQHHKIIDWLLKVKKSDLSIIHQEITHYIFSEEAIQKELSRMDQFENSTQYFIVRNLIALEKLDDELTAKFLTNKNFSIRLMVVQSLEQINSPELLKTLLKDKSQKIRNYALNKIPEYQLENFKLELFRLLFDKSKTIRSSVRCILSKLEDLDYPTIYRKELKLNSTLGCILGLSEVGDKTDAKLLLNFTTAIQSGQRAAALFSVSNLEYSIAKELAYQMLNDSSAKVKRTCLNVIMKVPSSNDLTRLRRIYDHSDYTSKIYILRSMNNFGGWDVAGDFLKGINEKHEAINRNAYSLLNSWYHYSKELGTELKDSHKEYVMGVYQRIDLNELDIPRESEEIIEMIPFIFGQKAD